MSRILLTILLVISLLLGIELREVGGKAVIRHDRSTVLGGNNQFAIDLFRALRARPGNVSLAPACLSTALAMSYEGAKGGTAEEMARALHLPADRETMRGGFSELLARLNGKGGDRPYRLDAANSLWGQEGNPFLPEFTARLADTYGAEIHAVDFRHAADSARVAIHGWVDGKTNGLIPQLLSPRDVRADTSLVLVSTVYFKGVWLNPFSKGATAPGDFRRADGSKLSTPMMHQTRRLPYAEGVGFGMLELPYKGGDLALDVVLPNEGVSLAQVEADLTLPALQQAIDRLGDRQVAVTMPKFRVKAAAELSDALAGVGMAKAFTPEADFRGIDGKPGLFLSKVVHQVVVNLDEEGTEAAAGSAVVATRSLAVRALPVIYRVDRPFLYVIRDVRTGAILFLGHVVDPSL